MVYSWMLCVAYNLESNKGAITMTENEEVMILENLRPGCGGKLSFSEGEICEAIDTAITALKEIQQYREVGTVEEFRKLKERSSDNE